MGVYPVNKLHKNERNPSFRELVLKIWFWLVRGEVSTAFPQYIDRPFELMWTTNGCMKSIREKPSVRKNAWIKQIKSQRPFSRVNEPRGRSSASSLAKCCVPHQPVEMIYSFILANELKPCCVRGGRGLAGVMWPSPLWPRPPLLVR